MTYHFLRTKYDDLEQLTAMEQAMNNASEDGFSVHSWHPSRDGVVVLMARPEPKAPSSPMEVTGQRRIGAGTPPAQLSPATAPVTPTTQAPSDVSTKK